MLLQERSLFFLINNLDGEKTVYLSDIVEGLEGKLSSLENVSPQEHKDLRVKIMKQAKRRLEGLGNL